MTDKPTPTQCEADTLFNEILKSVRSKKVRENARSRMREIRDRQTATGEPTC